MGLGGGGGGDAVSLMGPLLFAVVIFTLTPMIVTVAHGYGMETPYDGDAERYMELVDAYQDATGASTGVNRTVWALTGIYTPYGTTYTGDGSTDYLITPDGWISGERVTDYSPSQYDYTAQDYRVAYDPDTRLYYYTEDNDAIGVKAGDLYARVNMTADHKSSYFFSSSGRTDAAEGGFYYSYTGARYAFSPIESYYMYDDNGEKIEVVSSTTTLSLIWYSFQNSSGGISGQLILSHNDEGVSYITGDQITRAYNSDSYTANFPVKFGHVSLNLDIVMDPTRIAQGYTIAQCWAQGYWTIYVTGNSVDATSYLGSDYSLNVYEIWDTLIALFTFNAGEYFGGDEMASAFASLILVVPLYICLIAVAATHVELTIIAAILAAVQAIATLASHFIFI